MVTGDLNSPEGLIADNWSSLLSEELDLDILICPGELHYTYYSCRKKSIGRAGIMVAPNEVSWTTSSLNEALAKVKGISKSIRSVNCSWSGIPFSITPSELLQDKNASHLLEIQYGLKGDHHLAQIEILTGVSLVYELRSDWKEAVTSSFPTVQFEHLMERLVGEAESLSKNSSAACVCLFQGSDFLEATVYCSSRGLLLCNLYQTGSAEDTLYFVSHFFATFKLDPQKDEVILLGNQGESDMLVNLVKSHFNVLPEIDLRCDLKTDGFPVNVLRPILRTKSCG